MKKGKSPTKDPIYKRFLAALRHEAEKNWHRQKNALAMEIGVSPSTITDILQENSKATFETREALARACGYEYEEFLEFGRKLLAEKGEEPVAIDPFVEAIREYIKENNLELTPENAQKAVRALKEYAKAREDDPENIVLEYQELVKGFKNKKKGLLANKLMIRLEKLSRREFYKFIADLEGLVEELEEQEEGGTNKAVSGE